MAQSSTGNVEQEALAVGLRGQSREVAEHVSPSLGTTAMFLGARDLQFANSTFNLVGGDQIIHNYYYYNAEHSRDIQAIFRLIPNFRNVYQDILSKVTSGTGMWLIKGNKFGLWIEPNGVIKIFWGSGIPGAGKTLLATIVIEHLEALRLASDAAVCVCYVYFRYSDSSEMTVRSVLEVLVKQTLERHPDCLVLVEETYAQHLREDSEPTEAQLLALLRELACRMAVTFYILDALDEAPTRIQLAVLQTLASLSVKLFITSRPLEDVEEHFPEAYIFPIAAKDEDIELHISKVISKSANLQKLFRRVESSLREDMMTTIKRNCGGMFLHASLQLDALSECLSAREARRTLQAFPSRIEDVYHQSWARISNQSHRHASLAKAVLVWVLNASRSMAIEELERALATCPITHKFEPDRLVPGSTLMSLCHSLVVVEEETRLVRLVHYTAKGTLENLLHESFPHPQSLLAAVCITHLTACGFQKTTIGTDKEFRTALRRDPLLAYASEAWAFHARTGLDVEDTKRLTGEFIREITAFPAFTVPDRSLGFDILHPLHIVALYRLPLALIQDTVMWKPNVRTTVGQRSPLMLASQSGHEDLVAQLITFSEIQVNMVEKNGWAALMLAAWHGHEYVVKRLLTRSEIQVNLGDKNSWSALMVAARNGHTGVVGLLLEHPEIDANLVNDHGWSALVLAARYGCVDVVALLLAYPGILVNLVSPFEPIELSILMLAVESGHEGAVKLFLAHPEIQANLVNKDGWSALMLAACSGHEGAAKLLLAYPEIQVNLVSNDGSTALMQAARNGHENVVALLLAHPGIQINLAKQGGWSALILASWQGHKGIIKLLLAHPGIQVNLVKADGWSALMAAAKNGHGCVVALLLAHPEIQVNLVDENRSSALNKASRNGHIYAVALLLAHPRIQVNLVNQDGWSTLMLAAWQGHDGIIKQLLAHPEIQVNLANNDGWSALMAAARNGHGCVVKAFLAHPEIQVNLANNQGSTAIKMAAQKGHEAVVRLLLDVPHIDTTIRSTTDGHTALSGAQANGHSVIVSLLRDFDRRKAVAAIFRDIGRLSVRDSPDEDESDF